MQAIVDSQIVTISDALIEQYDRPLPRYTSYPPAPAWGPLAPDAYAAALKTATQTAASLYLHIPFCSEKCIFCGCHSIATSDRDIMARYARACGQELSLVAEAAGASLKIAQIHLGGGTPMSIGIDAVGTLIDRVQHTGRVTGDAELSIELDPRTIGPRDVVHLRELGFNRMSFGIQDFDPAVNASVRRRSDFETVRSLIAVAREAGVGGINVDLIYGLPHQSRDGWRRTLDQVLSLTPDRIAVFNFAYLPRALPHQRRIDPTLLPPAREKLAFFTAAIERFQSAGYAFIGLDHFARTEDPLERAHREGTLTRNFQGYATGKELQIVGIGTTAISELGNIYAQNEKRLVRYLERIESRRLATSRGMILTPDDLLRRGLIREILCSQRIEKPEFARENVLRQLQEEGLVVRNDDGLAVTPSGRLFIRAIAAAFDATLAAKGEIYSRNV